MQDQVLNIGAIVQTVRDNKGLLPPQMNTEYYCILSAEYCFLAEKLGDMVQKRAQEIAGLLLKDTSMSVSKAEKIADYSPNGQLALKLKMKLKGLEELIRALKKAQNYYEQQARGNY